MISAIARAFLPSDTPDEAANALRSISEMLQSSSYVFDRASLARMIGIAMERLHNDQVEEFRRKSL
jgi:hypothetical protein